MLKNVNTGENVSIPCISILPWYTNEAIYQIPSYNKSKKRGSNDLTRYNIELTTSLLDI